MQDSTLYLVVSSKLWQFLSFLFFVFLFFSVLWPWVTPWKSNSHLFCILPVECVYKLWRSPKTKKISRALIFRDTTEQQLARTWAERHGKKLELKTGVGSGGDSFRWYGMELQNQMWTLQNGGRARGEDAWSLTGRVRKGDLWHMSFYMDLEPWSVVQGSQEQFWSSSEHLHMSLLWQDHLW